MKKTMMFHRLHQSMLTMMFSLLAMAQGAENELRELSYKGNQQAWQNVGGSWQTNETGDLLVEGRGWLSTRSRSMAIVWSVASGSFATREARLHN